GQGAALRAGLSPYLGPSPADFPAEGDLGWKLIWQAERALGAGDPASALRDAQNVCAVENAGDEAASSARLTRVRALIALARLDVAAAVWREGFASGRFPLARSEWEGIGAYLAAALEAHGDPATAK